jgi:RimJ/RimL family protein N-acetyltransferase
MTAMALRLATMQDSSLLLQWRNDEGTRIYSRQTARIAGSEHLRWLQACLFNSDCQIWVGENHGEPVGQVRLDRIGTTAELDYAVAPEQRGHGFGSEMVQIVLAKCVADRFADAILASVHPDNVASMKTLRQCGFVTNGVDAQRFVRLRWQP